MKEESRLNHNEGFTFFQGHKKMQPHDADVFLDAIDKYEHPNLSKAISDAGGDISHKYYFSSMKCGNRPIDPWAGEQMPEHVCDCLKQLSEKLQEDCENE